jgi:hypothetical protein
MIKMKNTRHTLQAKVEFLQNELDALKDYYYVPETYQFLIEQLDAQQVLLKHLEVEEQFAAIESGATQADVP